MCVYEGGPQKLEFIYKKLCIYSSCLSFSHIPSPLHLMQHAHGDIFPTAQNSFWTRQFWCLLEHAPFIFTSSTLANYFPLRTFFHQKIAQGEIGWLGRVGHGGYAFFGQNLLGKCIKRVLTKFTEGEHSFSQQCQLVHRYGWVPRTLT